MRRIPFSNKGEVSLFVFHVRDGSSVMGSATLIVHCRVHFLIAKSFEALGDLGKDILGLPRFNCFFIVVR